jgi:tetratricopeptide (TPR) repeat protein
MVCPKIARYVSVAALAATQLCIAGPAQLASFTQRLVQVEQLRAHEHYGQALAALQSLLQDIRKEESDPRLEALVLDKIALNEQETGHYTSSEIAFNHVLDALSNEPADSALLITARMHLAELYIAEVRPADAEPILRQALQSEQASAKSIPMLRSVLNEDLAVTCIMQRKFSEPEALLRESQAIIAKEYGPADPRMASSLLTYAGMMTLQHRYSDAVEPAERALDILDHGPQPVPRPYRASALSVLAVVYYRVGRNAEAVDAALKSIELATASLGPKHPRLGIYLSNYATILKGSGRKNQAKAIERQAQEIRDQYPSSTSGGYTVSVLSLH